MRHVLRHGQERAEIWNMSIRRVPFDVAEAMTACATTGAQKVAPIFAATMARMLHTGRDCTDPGGRVGAGLARQELHGVLVDDLATNP